MRPSWSLRDIFELGLAEYLRTHRLPLHLHKAAQAIRRCRTAALGGHVKACPKGHVEKVFYNSCGHRACPQCAYLKTQEWLARKVDQLLACDHFHLTFTLPPELYLMWRWDYRSFSEVAFQAARGALFTLPADPKFAGALPGIHMTLHTWNRALAFFPHLHILITGGGLGADGLWKPARRRNSLLPTEVISVLFKAMFRDELHKRLDQGKIRLPPDMNENDARWQIQKALNQKWVIDRQKRYRHGRGVLTYFASYVRGGPPKKSAPGIGRRRERHLLQEPPQGAVRGSHGADRRDDRADPPARAAAVLPDVSRLRPLRSERQGEARAVPGTARPSVGEPIRSRSRKRLTSPPQWCAGGSARA